MQNKQTKTKSKTKTKTKERELYTKRTKTNKQIKKNQARTPPKQQQTNK